MRSPLPPLPITIAFGRPSRLDLSVGAAALGVLLASLVGTQVRAGSGFTLPRPPATPPPARAGSLLTVTTSAVGATVTIDGQPVGTAPLSVAVNPGPHAVTVQHPDALTETQTIEVPAEGSTVAVAQWRGHPALRVLQPSLPGAAIADASFLADGRLGLIVNLPGDERQAWTLDPADSG